MDVSQNLCDWESETLLGNKGGMQGALWKNYCVVVVVKEDASIVLTHFLHFPIGCWICG